MTSTRANPGAEAIRSATSVSTLDQVVTTSAVQVPPGRASASADWRPARTAATIGTTVRRAAATAEGVE